MCVFDKVERNLYHWVHSPFWSAGRIYGWPGSSAALGANRAILEYAKSHEANVRVFTQDEFGRCYQADPKDWIGFARKYKAIHWTNRTAIYVLQWCPEHFQTIRNDPVFGVVAALLQG